MPTLPSSPQRKSSGRRRDNRTKVIFARSAANYDHSIKRGRGEDWLPADHSGCCSPRSAATSLAWIACAFSLSPRVPSTLNALGVSLSNASTLSVAIPALVDHRKCKVLDVVTINEIRPFRNGRPVRLRAKRSSHLCFKLRWRQHRFVSRPCV